MYDCHNCKKELSRFQFRCPECGSFRFKVNLYSILLASVFCVLAILLLAYLLFPPRSNPIPPVLESTESTSASTEASIETTEATTLSTPDPLYTRTELEALDNTLQGYGPGPNLPNRNNRPAYALDNQKHYGEYGANFIAPDDQSIYLTFDCGYEHRIVDEYGKETPVTALILDTLKEKNEKAVFFVTMHYAQSEPTLVQRMIDEGHTLGNHTVSHKPMPSLSIDDMIEEVMTLHNYVKERYGYTMTLFRPPEGTFSVRSLAVVHSLGYKTVHWSFAYADWDTANQPNAAAALQNILNKAHSGAIYLLHAVSYTNASLLADAIDGFREKGFTLAHFQ